MNLWFKNINYGTLRQKKIPGTPNQKKLDSLQNSLENDMEE